MSSFDENFIQRGVNKELDDLIDQQKKSRFISIHSKVLNDVVKEEDNG